MCAIRCDISARLLYEQRLFVSYSGIKQFQHSTHLVASRIFAFKRAFLSAFDGAAILTGFHGGRSFSGSLAFLICLVDLLRKYGY